MQISEEEIKYSDAHVDHYITNISQVLTNTANLNSQAVVVTVQALLTNSDPGSYKLFFPLDL